MDVRIEPSARDFISNECGGVVILRGSRRHGCCGGTAFVPVAERGAPRDIEHYRSLQVDGLTVFVERDVEPGPAPLVIGVDGLWRWHRLRVDGSAIRM
jgi:hypothetical protein